MKKRKVYYKGQILAIVLVLIILAAIVGFAMVIRTMADKNAVMRERTYSEADVLSDSVIEDLSSADWNDIQSVCGDKLKTDCSVSGAVDDNKVSDMIYKLTGQTIKDLGFEHCENIDIHFKWADANDVIIVDKDRTLQIDSYQVDSTCGSMILTFPAGTYTNGSGLAIFKLYGLANSDGEPIVLDEYQLSDIEGLCFLPKGNLQTCFKQGGVNIGDKGDINYVIPLVNPQHSNKLFAVRLHVYSSPISLKWKYSNSDCSSQWIKTSVSASCQGQTSGKTFFIPPSFTTPSLFDYTLINNVGTLEPN